MRCESCSLVGVMIYQWNGAGFDKFQHIAACGARALESRRRPACRGAVQTQGSEEPWGVKAEGACSCSQHKVLRIFDSAGQQ